MVADFIAQIDSIPPEQLCEAFDPMMILPEKMQTIDQSKIGKENLGCLAPANVYMSGIRGKRFLCDFHYYSEYFATMCRTPEQWPEIAKEYVDNLEQIKDTFLDLPYQNISDACWCGKEGSVITADKRDVNATSVFCGFHFRKFYYRHISNGLDFDSKFDILVDNRKYLTQSIKEEYEQLTIL